MRRSDLVSLALLIIGMAAMTIGYMVVGRDHVAAKVVPPPTEDVAGIQIANLAQRMDRTDAENERRFDKMETMMQYVLGALFLNLGAHGLTLGRSRQGRDVVPHVPTARHGTWNE